MTAQEKNKQQEIKSNLDLSIQEIDEALMKIGLPPSEDVTGKGANYTVRFKKPSEVPSREERLESMKRAVMAMGKTEEEAEAMINNPF